MPIRDLQEGIQGVQAGRLSEGARLLRIALRNDQLAGDLRAVGCLWLAETSDDPEHKVDCYNRALAADPNNEQARQQLAALLGSALPGTAPPPQLPETPRRADPHSPQPPANQLLDFPTAVESSQRPPPSGLYGVPPAPEARPTSTPTSATFQRTIGVLGGPNGRGTGFFVTRDGLLVTTRYVVGGMENLTVEMENRHRLQGRVMRAFPDIDLAILQVEVTINQLLPVSQLPVVPDNTPLTAVAHGGQVMQGVRRATKHQAAAGWFPTTIDQVVDAGGNPIFDDRNELTGLLSKNGDRTSGYFYGLHIATIFKYVEFYVQEGRSDGQRMYCPNCGYLSQAGSIGAFYCEICGGILPYALDRARYPHPQSESLYRENMYQPCPHCSARVGYYDGRCLRCGNDISRQTRRRR